MVTEDGGNGGDPTDSYGEIRGGGGRDDKRKEFALVNPRNINIRIFTGKTLNINPYLPFNNAIRRFIDAQGVDGEELLYILDKVERMGANTSTNELLKDFTVVNPKAEELIRAVNAALLNWISGIAKGLAPHNVSNGLDAWRKLCHRYIQLASDLQDILIRELYDLKFVTEVEIDSLFDDVARIKDLYIKAGPSDDLSDRWIKSAVLRNPPEELAKHIAFELKKVKIIEDIQSLIIIYLHDPYHRALWGTGNLSMMMERGGIDKRRKEKQGQWHPRQTQTDREETLQTRPTIDQQDDDDDHNDDMNFESTMSRITNHRFSGITTDTPNKFQALQIDDDDDDDSEDAVRDENIITHSATTYNRDRT